MHAGCVLRVMGLAIVCVLCVQYLHTFQKSVLALDEAGQFMAELS